jgi:hypothetical protein
VNAYSPRRQSKRWLDGDVPREVLAIYKDNREPAEPYTVFYAALQRPEDGRGSDITYIGLSESGRYSHGSLPAYQAADFRYRNAHRACKWTDLPEAVRNTVMKDLESE